jgi:hypothetical protein
LECEPNSPVFFLQNVPYFISVLLHIPALLRANLRQTVINFVHRCCHVIDYDNV